MKMTQIRGYQIVLELGEHISLQCLQTRHSGLMSGILSRVEMFTLKVLVQVCNPSYLIIPSTQMTNMQ